MTVELEKIFFNYVYKNKQYVSYVGSSFFRNPDISYIYNILKKYMVENPTADVPSPQQLYTMISTVDLEGKITKPFLKALLGMDLSKYDENVYILPQLQAWITSNRVQLGTSEIIDLSRVLETTVDHHKIKELSEQIREIIVTNTNNNFMNQEDLGVDFDDADSHSQDHSVTKIKTGFSKLDEMTCGGWDRSTLIAAMAKTNAGKSIFMQNISAKAAEQGYNVVYFTLEMSEKKVLKRIGSMRLRIPINDYDRLSIDTDYIKERIDRLKKSRQDSFVETEDKKVGKIFVKFFAAGTASPSDFDAYLKKLKETKGVDIDLIVVDYINLMCAPKGLNIDNNLYMKGKNLAEGLRAIAAKYSAPVITATQLAKDAWDATDITLQDIPESKAIAETADLLLGLIVTDELKRDNTVKIKLLKQRDGDFSKMYLNFHINPIYLSYDSESD